MRHRSGLGLIEMTMVIAVFAFVLALGVALMGALFAVYQADAAFARRLATQAALADQFRRDVGAAETAPPRSGEVLASPDCLILKGREGVVIYRTAKDGVERIEGERNQAFALGAGERVVFEQSAGVATLRCFQLRGPADAAVERESVYSAALGGGLR